MEDDHGFSVETLPECIKQGVAGGEFPGPYGPLCDIGLNLLDDMFFGEYNGKQRHAEDVSLVLRRAGAVGVTRCILTAGNTEESTRALNYITHMTPSTSNSSGDDSTTTTTIGSCIDLEEKAEGKDKPLHSGLYSTVGVHPTRCNEFAEKGTDAVIERLESLLVAGKEAGKVVAVGEAGLDYDRLHFCEKEQQMIGFLKQIELAERHHLPMFLHDRNTGGDFLQVMSEHRSRLSRGGVVHSFTGSLEEMQAYVSLGLYIGINGCSLKTEENLQVVREIPLNCLLLETDAPWCGIKNTHASKPLVTTNFLSKKKEKYERGWLVKDRAEPCLMLQVLEVVAALKEMNPRDLAAIVHDNTNNLFFHNDNDRNDN